MITQLLYNLFIRLYVAAVYLASPFHAKARLWIKGRKNLLKEIEEKLKTEDRIIWFHAASLGEFEQGRPVMEEIRKKMPRYKILLTFFSPSGYEVRKNYEGADFVFYLPSDTPRNAWHFVKIVEPEIVFFIKYEFWFNYLRFLNMRGIPVYFISVIFRKDQHFFKGYGIWFRKMLQNVTHFFVQNEESLKLLNAAGIKHASLSSDTRFDRVWSAAQARKEFQLIASFAASHKILLAGSSWPQDEDLLVQFVNRNNGRYKYIIAPHEIDQKRISALMQAMKAKCIRYSEADEKNIADAEVLIIDSIGILLHLYQYATVAFLGGGFGKSIHNILEAATFGKPVIFGPRYHKFQEAHDLIGSGGAFCVHNFEEFSAVAERLLTDDAQYQKASEACSRYVETRRGATEQILKQVLKEHKKNR